MAHTHSLSEAHTHTGRQGDSALCVKSRISWRLFIMHNAPPAIECDRVKLLTQFVRTQAHKSLALSHSLGACVSRCVGVCVCKPSRRVNCLWGAHYSAVKGRSEARRALAKKRPKVAALANN